MDEGNEMDGWIKGGEEEKEEEEVGGGAGRAVGRTAAFKSNETGPTVGAAAVAAVVVVGPTQSTRLRVGGGIQWRGLMGTRLPPRLAIAAVAAAAAMVVAEVVGGRAAAAVYRRRRRRMRLRRRWRTRR